MKLERISVKNIFKYYQFYNDGLCYTNKFCVSYHATPAPPEDTYLIKDIINNKIDLGLFQIIKSKNCLKMHVGVCSTLEYHTQEFADNLSERVMVFVNKNYNYDKIMISFDEHSYTYITAFLKLGFVKEVVYRDFYFKDGFYINRLDLSLCKT